MKKYLLVSLVAIILTPSIALASWWNPISWFASNEVEKPLVIVSSSTSVFSPQTETTKTISSFSWWNPLSWFRGSATSRNSAKNVPTEQVEQNHPVIISDSASTTSAEHKETRTTPTDTEQNRLQVENEKLKAENALTNQKLETAQSKTEQERLKAEIDKLKSENETKLKQEEVNKGFYCNGKYSTQSCSVGRKLQCPPTGDAVCVGVSDVLCNGKYWAQCPVGQTFICPQIGEASCTTPKSSVDLNKAASNKAELITLWNTEISGEKKLLEDLTNEVSRMNNILNELAINYEGGKILVWARNYTIANRDFLTANQSVETTLIQRAENRKRMLEGYDVSAFTNETDVSKIRDQINADILDTSQQAYKNQNQKATYNDTMRASIPTLNFNP